MSGRRFRFDIRQSARPMMIGICVWLALGLVVLMGATNLKRYAPLLKLAFVLIFAGGLARISQPDILFDPAILGSFIAEIVGMPVLYVWVSKFTEPRPAQLF